jgi:hydrogenase maturation protease
MPSLLVGGIGNIFFGDDGFGVEVVRRLAERPLPADVALKDFGIRGFDLAYALMEAYEAVLLVDAAARGHTPGTLTWLVPEVPPGPATEDVLVDAHHLEPAKVLRMVEAMGGVAAPVEIVTCEPLTFGSEDEPVMGLSAPVLAAVPEAIAMIEAWVRRRQEGARAHA